MAAAAPDGTGGVLGLPPVHARTKDDDQQQRDEAAEHAWRHRRSRSVSATSSKDRQFYYHNAAASRSADQGRRAGVLPVQERRARSGSACRCRRVIVRVYQSDSKGGAAVRRRGPDRPHAEGRDAQPQDRERVRCRVRAQADRLREDRGEHLRGRYEITLRNHKADAGSCRGERADWRDLADAPLVARVDEDGGVGRAVPGAGDGQWLGDAQLPCAGHLLTRPSAASALARSNPLAFDTSPGR